MEIDLLNAHLKYLCICCVSATTRQFRGDKLINKIIDGGLRLGFSKIIAKHPSILL